MPPRKRPRMRAVPEAVIEVDAETEVEVTGWVNPLGKLVNSPLFSDARIIVGKDRQTMHAHRAILASHSEVLKALFESPTVEGNSGVIVLEDFLPSVVLAFLSLIYCGKAKVVPTDLYGLYKLCHFYQVTHLMEALHPVLQSTVHDDNVFDAFAFAQTYSGIMLGHVLEYIRPRAEHLFLTVPDTILDDLTAEQMCTLLADNGLVVEEKKIWDFAVRWATRQAAQQSERTGVDDWRPFMEPLIPHIRLSLIPLDTLRTCIVPLNIIPSSALLPAIASPVTSERRRGIDSAFSECSSSLSLLAGGTWSAGTSPRSTSCLNLTLVSAPSDTQHVWHWQLPIGEASAARVTFKMGDITFSMHTEKYSLDPDIFGVFLQPTQRLDRTVRMEFAVLKHKTLERTHHEWLSYYFADMLDIGFSKWQNLREVIKDLSWLHGPNRDHLLIQFQLRLLPPRKLTYLVELSSGMQLFDLQVPELGLDRFHEKLHALDRQWMLFFTRKNNCITLDRLTGARSTFPYSCTVTLIHPTEDERHYRIAATGHDSVRMQVVEENLQQFVWSDGFYHLHLALQLGR